MTRWKLTIEYDGTQYYGWQTQAGKNRHQTTCNTVKPLLPTVQDRLENALCILCQQPIHVHVAGRTDTGVHATGQVVHADMPRVLSPDRMRLAIQAHLLDDAITIRHAETVPADFHARFSATMRHYRYWIAQSATPPALLKDRVWWLPKKLDIPAMQKAAQDLLGEHDFTSFRASGCQANHPNRSISKISIYPDIVLDTPVISFEFAARSFLYHQVRNMVGTLAEIGLHRRAGDDIARLLLLRDRRLSAATAPAAGLYFSHVEYA